MENNHRPAIVVIAFNRAASLRRLLSSLEKANYPEKTPLVISIDYAPDNQDVYTCARDFYWPYGKKEIIYHREKKGLKTHVLSCGDLVDDYGSVIILEDDLYVSPYFYHYTSTALDYYANDEKIAGISLFNYPRIEKKVDPPPFYPLIDHSDVYFIQYAASSGQAWTRDQWKAFRRWHNKSVNFKEYRGVVPSTVLQWPPRSWKKYFITYMTEKDKYFVFPTISLTTNFDDKGSNRQGNVNELQTKLKLDDRPLIFKPLSHSFNVYDAFFEILPEKLNNFCPYLRPYNYAVDLYGIKNLQEIKKEYVLTTKRCTSPVKSYGRHLKPHEMNIIFDIPGSDISLCHCSDLMDVSKDNKYHYYISDFSYFYKPLPNRKDIMKFLKYRVNSKLKKILN